MGFFSTLFATHDYSLQPSSAEDVDISAANHTFTKPHSLWVGVGGDVVIIAADGGQVTLKGVSSGQTIPILVSAVVKVGTTASDIVGIR